MLGENEKLILKKMIKNHKRKYYANDFLDISLYPNIINYLNKLTKMKIINKEKDKKKSVYSISYLNAVKLQSYFKFFEGK